MQKYEFHPWANTFPMLDDRELRELADDIAKNGLRHPILLAEGKIADGRNRYQACELAGVAPRFVEWDGNGSLLDAIVSDNLKRRHLDAAQRAIVAARLKPIYEEEAKARQEATRARPGQQVGQAVANLPPPTTHGKARDHAAAALNVSPRSVEYASAVLRDGTEELVNAVERGEVAVSTAARIAKLPVIEQPRAIEAAKAHVSYNSGNNEWYTPEKFIVAATEVLGAIDLDPASSDVANRTVQATNYYTAETNGLLHEWAGRVFMNPPYSADLIGQFATKLAVSFRSGAVTEAIVLVNNATETSWFVELAQTASAVCFPTSRIRFTSPDPAKTSAPLQGQAVLYMGPQNQRFRDVFDAFGWSMSR